MTGLNASRAEFSNVINKGCFFHLCQNIWQKIHDTGLASIYGSNENFCLLMRHIGALAFLPPNEIVAGFEQLKTLLPDIAADVVTWFDENYVNGRIRRTNRNGLEVRVPPLFLPETLSATKSRVGTEDGRF